ncbi:MAG: YdcF family protein [Clostridia bacterium]|nr:YdcF family protein [Clostridia bacterium]
MKLSKILPAQIRSLSPENVTEIVFGDFVDDGGFGQVALILGGNPRVLMDRAKAAAALFFAGRVEYLMPTGGVEWDSDKGRCTEAEYLKACLLELGVPQEVILLENEARTTHENMVCSTLLMMRVLKIKNVRRVYVVTSPSHLRRSLEYARIYLPRTVDFAGYTDLSLPDGPSRWTEDPFYAERVYREGELLCTGVLRGWFDEIEFGEKTE